jgi:hypothetical protein
VRVHTDDDHVIILSLEDVEGDHGRHADVAALEASGQSSVEPTRDPRPRTGTTNPGRANPKAAGDSRVMPAGATTGS